MDELFKLIQLFVVKFPDSTEQEIHEINNFKKQTLQLYLQVRCYKTRIFSKCLLALNWDLTLGIRHLTFLLKFLGSGLAITFCNFFFPEYVFFASILARIKLSVCEKCQELLFGAHVKL